MTSNQGTLGGRFTLRLGSNRLTALEQLAYARSSPHNMVNRTELMREAVDLYLEENYDELPEESKDLLDDDLVANAGGEEDEAE